MIFRTYGLWGVMNNNVNILVCGDRNWTDKEVMHDILDGFLQEYGSRMQVIQGGARGADTIAKEWSLARDIPCITVEAEWDKYGRAAGPIRNKAMLAWNPEFVIAFHEDLAKSKGTRNMVLQARTAGINVVLVKGRQ